MKKLTILAVALLMMTSAAQAQGIEKILDKYSNDERFTYVSVGTGLIQLVVHFIETSDTTVKAALSKFKGVKVLSLDDEFDNKLAKTVVDELNAALKQDKNAESVIETRKHGDITKIYITSEGLLIINQEIKELSVVFLNGKLPKKTLLNLAKSINTSGMMVL
jgi:hypothetical protein